MSVFQVTSLLGTCTTIFGILDPIRKCRKAEKKITSLIEDALDSLHGIKKQTPLVSLIFEVGGLNMATFLNIARRTEKVGDELEKLDENLQKMNRAYKFITAPVRVETLRDICMKLERIERDLENAIPSAQLRVQVSVLLEAQANKDVSHETKLLPVLDNGRKPLGTYALISQLDRQVSDNRSNEGTQYLILGKMH